jgi:hypothetical protein
MIKRTKREAFALSAVHKQLEIAGVDKSVLETDHDSWFSNNTITEEQHAVWKAWFIGEARRIFHMTKKSAEKEFSFFDLGYGLRVADSEKVK